MNKKFIIGYDFGTSSLKAALIDEAGNVVADCSQSYPVYMLEPNRVEQDPSDWWNAMRIVTARLLQISNQAPSSIAAISICAQMCGVIPVNKHGKPISNCIIWLDTRSRETARRITRGAIRMAGYGVIPLMRWLWYTNGAPNLAGRDPVSKMLWLKEHEPELWNNTYKFLDVKDYLVYRCCRRFTTTLDCAHLTWLLDSRPHKKCWSEPLLSRLDIDRHLLPEICAAEEIVGELDRVSAEELGLKNGTAIIAGAGDVTASALGAGSLSPTEPHLHIGTSAWIGVHMKKRSVDVFNGIGTICSADKNSYLLVAAQQSGAFCLDWVCRSFNIMRQNGPDYSVINDMVADSPVGAKKLLFLPWLLGECVPRNISADRAGFINLSSRHNLEDIFRAVLEGIGMNIRWAFEAMDFRMKNYQNTRFIGSGAYTDNWCQIMADMFNMPVQRIEKPHLAGASGCAMLAAVALGWKSSLTEAVKSAKIDRIFYPDVKNAELYTKQFELFLDYYKRNKATY